ncbi:outer membrane lipoprotein carrier protein LolA [Terasakiella pusilla]|uniref:outer membrane lipoprotein carrier protein LolA n=1 Tax=Terasakiella pusilla TaxID=64973 RepID=UPI00048F20D5|nr:outer membrane lipoprotein carrier protein LolA [Terasakiella pusilla]
MRLLTLLTLLFLSVSVQAQERPTQLQDGETLRGDFTQLRYLNGFNHAIKSSGVFEFTEETGLDWQTQTPFATRLIVSEKGMVQYVDGVETLKVTPDKFPALSTLHEVLTLSMTGAWDQLEAKYQASLEAIEGGWQLTFKPDGEAPFEAVTLTGAEYLDQLVIRKPEGDRDEITFSNQHVTKARP